MEEASAEDGKLVPAGPLGVGVEEEDVVMLPLKGEESPWHAGEEGGHGAGILRAERGRWGGDGGREEGPRYPGGHLALPPTPASQARPRQGTYQVPKVVHFQVVAVLPLGCLQVVLLDPLQVLRPGLLPESFIVLPRDRERLQSGRLPVWKPRSWAGDTQGTGPMRWA